MVKGVAECAGLLRPPRDTPFAAAPLFSDALTTTNADPLARQARVASIRSG